MTVQAPVTFLLAFPFPSYIPKSSQGPPMLPGSPFLLLWCKLMGENNKCFIVNFVEMHLSHLRFAHYQKEFFLLAYFFLAHLFLHFISDPILAYIAPKCFLYLGSNSCVWLHFPFYCLFKLLSTSHPFFSISKSDLMHIWQEAILKFEEFH